MQQTLRAQSSYRTAFSARRQCRAPARRINVAPRAIGGLQEALNSAPPEALLAGVSTVLSAIGGIAYAATQNQAGEPVDAPAAGAEGAAQAPVPRENAVLVFGASGRTGREIVAQLVKAGHTVVAACRTEDKGAKAFEQQGLALGRQPGGSGVLVVQGGVDVTKAETLTADLFQGVTQVICSTGAVFGRLASGEMGYLDDMTSERVDAQGTANIAAAAARYLPRAPSAAQQRGSPVEVLPLRSEEDVAKWQRLDDVIMGGQSSSALAVAPDGSVALWSGELVVEGGGFCGHRTVPLDLDLSAYDGLALRVKSDQGQTFKLNIKTSAFQDPEDTFQATFETVAGKWVDVRLPWHVFVPVKRNRSVPDGPSIDPATIKQFGLVYSRFEFNGLANPAYVPGKFELLIEGGLKAYSTPKPQLIMVSSAGVERNAKIGDDAERRKQDIPIVQLNPGGVLNHKYAGEIAVRASGLAYTVVRPTGLSQTEATEGGPFQLEARQGDKISGMISRGELASLVAFAASSPAAAGKTFEVRRQAQLDVGSQGQSERDTLRMLLSLATDAARQRVGLEPFPAYVPPPEPVTEERKKEILSDERVQASVAAGRGGRVRDEKESAEAQSITVTSDGRKEAAQAAAAGEVPANVAEARQWIAAWRAKNGKAAPAAGAADNVAEARQWIADWRAKNGKGAASGSQDGAAVPENVREAREWIRRWRAARLESQLPQEVKAQS